MTAQELRSVRAKFVRNVKEPTVNSLLDDLMQDGVLNEGEKDYIIQKYSVIADRARQLIDTVISKGDDSSRKMIDHLFERDPALCSGLSQPPQPPQPGLFRVRPELIQWMTRVTINQVLDDLVQDGIFTNEEKYYILVNHTTADKARELVNAVMKKGDDASRKMIGHLKERDPLLYSELGLSGSQPPQPAVQVKKNTEWSTTLIPATDAFWNEKQKDPHVYPVDKKSIGNRVALLITNIKFTNPKFNRDGAERDEENMEKLLSDLKYEVVKRRNLTAQEIDNALIQFSKHPKLRQTDSVVVVIMSHGKNRRILGVNYKEEEPTDVFPINNIYEHLDSKKCPALVNKPKIIIIQACRGDLKGAVRLDSDSASQVLVCDDASQPGAEGEMEEDAAQVVHKEKDFIALLSSTPGTVSYRNKVSGSVLIQYIVEVFNTLACEDDIDKLFTKVIRRVATDLKIKQVPTKDRWSLMKDFYFFPGH